MNRAHTALIATPTPSATAVVCGFIHTARSTTRSSKEIHTQPVYRVFIVKTKYDLDRTAAKRSESGVLRDIVEIMNATRHILRLAQL